MPWAGTSRPSYPQRRTVGRRIFWIVPGHGASPGILLEYSPPGAIHVRLNKSPSAARDSLLGVDLDVRLFRVEQPELGFRCSVRKGDAAYARTSERNGEVGPRHTEGASLGFLRPTVADVDGRQFVSNDLEEASAGVLVGRRGGVNVEARKVVEAVGDRVACRARVGARFLRLVDGVRTRYGTRLAGSRVRIAAHGSTTRGAARALVWRSAHAAGSIGAAFGWGAGAQAQQKCNLKIT